jgi:hypothetical protein
MNRDNIIKLHENRMTARSRLADDTKITVTYFHPRAMFWRFTQKMLLRVHETADKAVAVTKKNTVLIGFVGGVALLFIGRRPISKFVREITAGKDKASVNVTERDLI